MDSFQQRPVKNTNLPVLLPILLADSSALERWPTSRIGMPVQFQRKMSDKSPFEEVLCNLSRIENLLPPIISLSSASLRPGLDQLEAYSAPESATLLVAPLNRGSLHCAIVSALLAHESYSNSLMVVIDCTAPPTNWQAFGRLLPQIQQTPLNKEAIIACGHPTIAQQSTLLTVNRADRTSDPKYFTCSPAKPGETETVFEIGSALFSTPEIFLNSIKQLSPETYANCNNALQNAEQNPGGIWPNFNIWSILDQQDLMKTLIRDCSTLILRPMEVHDPAEVTPADSRLIFTENTENCSIETDGHLIAVAGCENLRIVSTKDATLIVKKNNPESILPILDRLRSQERSELYELPVIYHDWGKETRLQRCNEYAVTRIEVLPDMTIPNHSHKGRMEFVHVLSGKGEATVGTGVYPLAPGLSLTVPAKTSHTIRNSGDSPLLLLETQHIEAPQINCHSAGINVSSAP